MEDTRISLFLENLKQTNEREYDAYTYVVNPIKFDALLHLYGVEPGAIYSEDGPGMCVFVKKNVLIQAMVRKNVMDLIHCDAVKNVPSDTTCVFYYGEFCREDNKEDYLQILKNAKKLIQRGNKVIQTINSL
jgi:hypothetical protein